MYRDHPRQPLRSRKICTSDPRSQSTTVTFLPLDQDWRRMPQNSGNVPYGSSMRFAMAKQYALKIDHSGAGRKGRKKARGAAANRERMKRKDYDQELQKLHIELVKLQLW